MALVMSMFIETLPLGGYKLIFRFGHSYNWLSLKSEYLGPKDSDSKGTNANLKAKQIFEILAIEVFKWINFGTKVLESQWSKRLRNYFLLKFRPQAIDVSSFQVDPTAG